VTAVRRQGTSPERRWAMISLFSVVIDIWNTIFEVVAYTLMGAEA
jgi:hypothetical protein